MQRRALSSTFGQAWLRRVTAWAVPLSLGGCTLGSPANRPHDVLVVALDTVRWDRTGLSGHPGDLTPNLDAFAALPGAVTFTAAYTDAAWSQPAYTSLFTGQQALTHGVGFLQRALAPGQATLASMLQAHGYETRAYASGPHLAPITGLAEGFDQFNHSVEQRTIGIQVHAAADWLLSDRPDGRPRFGFVHGYDAHAPYGVPAVVSAAYQPVDQALDETCEVPGWRCLPLGKMSRTGPALSEGRRTQLEQAYAASVAYADHQLGRLLYALEVRGQLDDTIVVVLSDHGEMLGEDGGLGHDEGYTDAVYHVPLVVRFPSQDAPRRVDRLVSLSDLVPTLAKRLDMVPPGGADGRIIGELLDPAIDGTPHPHRGASSCCYYIRDQHDAAWALHGTGTLDWQLLPGTDGRDDAATLARILPIFGDWPQQLTGLQALNQESGNQDPALKAALKDRGYWKTADP